MKQKIFIGAILIVAVFTGLFLTNRPEPKPKLTPQEKADSVNAG